MEFDGIFQTTVWWFPSSNMNSLSPVILAAVVTLISSDESLELVKMQSIMMTLEQKYDHLQIQLLERNKQHMELQEKYDKLYSQFQENYERKFNLQGKIDELHAQIAESDRRHMNLTAQMDKKYDALKVQLQEKDRQILDIGERLKNVEQNQEMDISQTFGHIQDSYSSGGHDVALKRMHGQLKDNGQNSSKILTKASGTTKLRIHSGDRKRLLQVLKTKDTMTSDVLLHVFKTKKPFRL